MLITKADDDWGKTINSEACPPIQSHLTLEPIANRYTFCKSAFSTSIAREPACPEAAGKPPTFANRSSAPIFRAAATVLPFANSVIADPHAIAGTHPFARKRISAIRSPSNFKLSSNTSPHAGFSNCAVASAVSTMPLFRGFAK